MIYTLILVVSSLCLLFAIAAGYQEMQRLEKQLELEKTKLKVPDQILKAKSDAQQSTREKVSEILDTQVSSLLNSANVQLCSIDNNEVDSLKKAISLLQTIKEQITCFNPSKSVEEIHKIGIVSALHDLAGLLSSPGFSVVIITDIGKLRLTKSKELFIYQSCAEFLQNSMKHSNATSCKVCITCTDQAAKIRVLDNGINTAYSENSKGLGLAKIKNKAVDIGGRFNFEIMAFGAQSELVIPIAPVAYAV